VPDLDELCRRHHVDRTLLETCIRQGRDVSETTMSYDGRAIPFLVIGPLPEEVEQFIAAMARFCWESRHILQETTRSDTSGINVASGAS
jgi:hypothetical protein